MTQEERDEIQDYLDERIFGTRRQMRSKHANSKLVQKQMDDLYQVVKDIKDMTIREMDGTDLDNALDTVVRCLKQCNFHVLKKGFKQSKNIVPVDKMPLLVKQVLWLICYKALQVGLTQKRVYEELRKHKIKISHNFFSSLEQTPDYFLRCEKYFQPVNPCKYKGQKKDELAVAIKNLVYQAGKHSYFVDVFGGSGSASAAVCHKKRGKYVYNEKNARMYNYIEVISGKLYRDLIKCMELIQEDLRPFKRQQKSSLGFDIQAEIKKYINNKRNKEKVGKDEERVIKDEEKVCEFGNVEYQLVSKSDKSKIKAFEKAIKEKDTAFFWNPDSIYMCSTTDPSNSMRYSEYMRRLMQYKALGYYAYFMNLQMSTGGIRQDDKVEYAAGEIYLHYFNVRGTISSSEIRDYEFLRPYADRDSYKERKLTVYNFTYEENYKEIISNFHNALYGSGKNWTVENQDFRNIISQYADEKTLFYSDSPYLGTSDYKNEESGVSPFTEGDMKELLDLLMQREVRKGEKYEKFKNHFIFSMRAVISKEMSGKSVDEKKTQKKMAKIKKGNKEIYQNIYKRFMKFQTKLYVLLIYKKGENWEEIIANDGVLEIMVTNYKIVDFNPVDCDKFVFHALPYCEFMKGYRSNVNSYDNSWKM